MAQKARGDTADILLNLNWQRTLCARAGFAPPQRRDPPEVGAFPFRTSPKPIRIVWIVFDELSQEIAFANRPADLRLPISTVCGRRASTPPQPSLLSPPAGKAQEELPPATRISSIEAERELVQVVVQMLPADGTLMSAQQPSLQQGCHTVHPRKQI
jgi:hypothetical protein